MDKSAAILLATYNGEKYLREQLDSIVKQTYNDFVCYIHDDGSIDGTVHILHEYQNNFPDIFKILEFEAKHDACSNFLTMLKYTTEAYISFCDQDDVWFPNKLELCVETIQMAESSENVPIAVFTDLEVVDSELNCIDSSFWHKMNLNPNKTSIYDLMKSNCAPGCSMMINRVLGNLAVKYTDSKMLSMHDVWCMMIASEYGKVIHVDKSMIKYRQHSNNEIGAKRETNLSKMMDVIKNNKIKKTKAHIKKKRSTAIQTMGLSKPIDAYTEKQVNDVCKIAKIDKCNKLQRMLFYLHNKLYCGTGLMIIICC